MDFPEKHLDEEGKLIEVPYLIDKDLYILNTIKWMI
jgi:hypothetical protein